MNIHSREHPIEPRTPLVTRAPRTPSCRSLALTVLLLAAAGAAIAGDRYDGAFTRSPVQLTLDPTSPSPGLRISAPHPWVDTLGTAVGAFTGCIVPVDRATVRFIGGTVTFVYTDGATSTATCEDWTQVPLHGCAVGPAEPFRCTFTGGTGRLATIAGFFDVRYFDNSEIDCFMPGMPDILGYVVGHVRPATPSRTSPSR